jgi:hypothetical protein
MKKTLYTIAALLILTTVFICTNPNPPYGQKKPLVKKEEMSIGTKDNPNARRDYEFMMLRDPVTNKIPYNIYNLEQEFANRLPKVTDLDNANSLVWSERGPNNVGGRTRALAPDVTNTNIILAGGVSGGMWRSVNFGTSWTKTTTNAQLHSTTCIAQDTRTGKTNIWYVGTGERNSNSASVTGGEYFGNGIFKSIDGGMNWTLLPSTMAQNPPGGGFTSNWQFVWNVVTDPSNASQDNVFAATINGIYKSSNAGTNWIQVLGDTIDVESTDITITQAGVVYAAGSSAANSTMSGIRRSTTGGTSWENITPAGFPPEYGRIVLTTAPSNPNILYAVVQGTPAGVSVNKHQFWKYTFNGTIGTWENRTANLPQAGQGNLGIENEPFDSQEGFDLFIKVKPDNENFVMLQTTNIYRSTDGFATTANTRRIGGYLPIYVNRDSANNNYPNHHADVHSGFFKIGSNIQYVSGHDGGISVTTDITANVSFNKPVTWTKLNNGYNVTQFYGVAIAPEAGSQKLVGGFQDNGSYMTTSSTLSVPWTDVSSGDGGYCEYAPDLSKRAYTASQNGPLYRINFDNDSSLLAQPYLARKQLFVNPFALDPNNSNIMFYAGGYDTATQKTGIWRNLNMQFADTIRGWSFLTGSDFGNTPAPVSAIGISKANNPNVVYYGTTTGSIKRITNSNLPIPNITEITRDTGMPQANISCLAVDPTNSTKVMAIFSNYNVKSIWYSTNSGTTWTNHEGNLFGQAGPSIRWAEIFYVQSVMHIVLSTSTGIYYTTNLNGINTVWTQEAVSAIGNVVCVMTRFRSSDNTLIVATHGRGAFQSQVTVPISVGTISTEIPLTYSLSQNYPNPFNPTTNIKISIAGNSVTQASQIVKLKIFDVTGKQVAALVNEKLAPGTYSVPFNASMLPSGVYFYQLTSGAFSESKRMILLK